MKNDWESIKQRAEKVKQLNEEDQGWRKARYIDKKTGREGIPRTKSPFNIDRGRCSNCGEDIKEPVADDRFCNKCYNTLFPGSDIDVNRA